MRGSPNDCCHIVVIVDPLENTIKAMSSHNTVTLLTSRNPSPSSSTPPSHHIGTPPTHFQNPWPSFSKKSLLDFFSTRFSSNRNFVPVPSTRDELVKVREPDWGASLDPTGTGLKATWIGHASWLLETGTTGSASRGVRILCDPVFSERTSPVQWTGPKRYTPTPCTVAELPEVDAVVISHNHYDHLDFGTIKELYTKQQGRVPHVFCALGNKQWFLDAGVGITKEDVTELDWWEGGLLEVADVGKVELWSVPCQHNSARSGWDQNRTLWCSWVIKECGDEGGQVISDSVPTAVPTSHTAQTSSPRSLYFAGDTAYRSVTSASPTPAEEASAPHCPAFSEIGNVFGPFDLALLPIGLFMPRNIMSSVHCSPEDSACVHVDIKAKRSLGMHYGTVRGGISGQYEDVRVPPRRWREACEERGWKWRGEGQEDGDWEAGLCDVGETVVIR